MLAGDAVTDSGPAPSCEGLAPTCGPAGMSPCCGHPVVTGGRFLRGFDVGTDGAHVDDTHPATVSDFRLDTYEVTVGRFRQFVNAGVGTQTNPPATGAGARMLNGMANQGGWDPSYTAFLGASTADVVAGLKCHPTYQTWTDAPGANESLPINCVSWYEAFAFCAWDGGFLPTEAEWMYAAAGGSDHRAFPWSSPASSLTLDCSYANYRDSVDCVNPPVGFTNRVGTESPAGDGKYGQSDLAGNVFEWTLDNPSVYAEPCDDCAALPDSGSRVIHGGSFATAPMFLRGAQRTTLTNPVVGSADIGVRCAALPRTPSAGQRGPQVLRALRRDCDRRLELGREHVHA